MEKKHISILIITLLLLLGYYHNCHQVGCLALSPNGVKIIYSRWAMQKSIVFFGRVVDLQERPIAGARVHFHIRAMTGDKKKVIETDERGMFEVTNGSGVYLYIDEVEKKGYEYKRDVEKISFTYGADLEKNIFKPDKNNPVVLHMREKEPPTLVLPCNFGLTNNSVKEMEIDLTRCEQYPGKIQENFGRIAHADLKAKIETLKGAHYKLIIDAPDDESGLISSDELAYVAPESGYQPRLELMAPLSGELKKYLYVKSRAGKVYARIDAAIRVREKDISIGLKSWTNPNGQRNVDFDDESFIEYLHKKDEQENKRRAELTEKDRKEDRKNKSLWWRIFH